MLPGLPSLPSSQLLPMLHQAWLSRASTHATNTYVQTSGFGFPPSSLPSSLPFPFPNPFLTMSTMSSMPSLSSEKIRGREEAEDLSFNKRFHPQGPQGGLHGGLQGPEVICPICAIAVRREDLAEHFEAELRCLDNIRSLSPIARTSSPRPYSRPSPRPYSTSPPTKSSSLSPCSPGYTDNRWDRFERIRSKRRERIGVRMARRERAAVEKEEDIDIGDSLSDCGSGSDTETGRTLGSLQYTEADVLRCLSGAEERREEAEEGGPSRGLRCPACSGAMNTPVLNVNCWHLKCESCWLRAVGTSKVCSLCSVPASVRELRKVHV